MAKATTHDYEICKQSLEYYNDTEIYRKEVHEQFPALYPDDIENISNMSEENLISAVKFKLHFYRGCAPLHLLIHLVGVPVLRKNHKIKTTLLKLQARAVFSPCPYKGEINIDTTISFISFQYLLKNGIIDTADVLEKAQEMKNKN